MCTGNFEESDIGCSGFHSELWKSFLLVHLLTSPRSTVQKTLPTESYLFCFCDVSHFAPSIFPSTFKKSCASFKDHLKCHFCRKALSDLNVLSSLGYLLVILCISFLVFLTTSGHFFNGYFPYLSKRLKISVGERTIFLYMLYGTSISQM